MSEVTPQQSAPGVLRKRRLRIALSGLIATVLMALTVGALWPTEPCSHPSCARTRFSLELEVDAFKQIPPIAFEVATSEGEMSLQSILASGGIDLTVHIDDLEVPYSSDSGPLDRADLYQFVSAWRSRTPRTQADARLYALFTGSLISDKGEQLFGMMFDLADREAFAVAPRTTERFFQARESDHVATLQLRTFIHELLHALNRDHADAAAMDGGRLSLEAPTRCIAQAHAREWSLIESPLMALSPSTIRFFQTAASRDVLPGKDHSPFEHRRTSVSECEFARANIGDHKADSAWQAAARRLRSLFAVQSAAAAEDPQSTPAEQDETSAVVALQAQVAPYPLAYPIAVRVSVTNDGESSLPIKGRLNPGYGLIQIDHRRAGEDDWRTFQPQTWFEPTGDVSAQLEPGERADETVAIFFGEDGWTFATPGDYELRARLQLPPPARDATSSIVPIRVVAPEAEDDRLALQPLLDSEGELDESIGRLLSFGGRIGNSADSTPLESVAALYGHTALGGALRLTLLSQRLRPAIDPRTGERPQPDFADARVLVEDTCTDSGVAALAAELLVQRAASLPADFRVSASGTAAAWDGTTAKAGETVATYSDPSLTPVGASLHFCFNEATPRAHVARALPRVAREVLGASPSRVVVVGHGDHAGSCRFNDELALRRAHSVRAALIGAGVSARKIVAVSLGERRPLDFSSGEQADAANRRVEILIETTEPSTDQAQSIERVLPRCPQRAGSQ